MTTQKDYTSYQRTTLCPKCKEKTKNVMLSGKASGMRYCKKCGTFYRIVLEKV